MAEGPRRFLFVGSRSIQSRLEASLRSHSSIAASAFRLETRSRAALYLGRRNWLLTGSRYGPRVS